MVDIGNELTLVVLLVVIWLLLRYFFKGNMTKPLLETEGLGEGKKNTIDSRAELLGKIGVAVTDLNPAGRAQIEEWCVEVLADRPFIAKGAHIKVYKIEGNTRLVTEVRRIRLANEQSEG